MLEEAKALGGRCFLNVTHTPRLYVQANPWREVKGAHGLAVSLSSLSFLPSSFPQSPGPSKSLENHISVVVRRTQTTETDAPCNIYDLT